MPYIIAFVIIIVAAGALLLFNRPVEAPVTTSTEEALLPTENQTVEGVPEGFTSPTTPPPSNSPSSEEAMIEMEASIDFEPELKPEAAAAVNETFIAMASYFTPRRTEHDIAVTLELNGTTIVNANVTYDGEVAKTPAHSGFDSAYATEVIGKNINDIELSRTGGASLTSVAFNEAVAEIRAQL
jgi:hypothetical protein